MQKLRVAAAALRQTPLDWKGNVARMRAVLEDARAAEAHVVCLPELAASGYGCEDAFHSLDTIERSWSALEAVLPATKDLVACIGLPVLHRGGVYNAVALVADTRVVALGAKSHLAGDGIHYEPRWFKEWPDEVTATYRRGDLAIPIGDMPIEVGGIRYGFEICEDAWVATRPAARLAAQGVDIVLNPSASHFALGKQPVRRNIVEEGARAFGVTYVYANLLGNEAGRAIYDGSCLIASDGVVVAESPRFSMREHALVMADVDVDLTRARRARTASAQPDVRDPAYEVRRAHAYPALRLPCPPAEGPVFPETREEELARALATALFDYLRKSHARGYVVSLSGGADSSACACLVHLVVRFALDELGADGLRAVFPFLAPVPGDARAVTAALLTTMYQSTRNSGEVTRNAARAVAEAIGSKHLELDVDAVVETYVRTVGDALGRALAWSTDDVALQNVQARVRAPSAWLVANVEGKLLITTSNRSEAAVGYATMDGDTAGGVSPLSGVSKAYLRKWLAWLEKSGPSGIGPIPALAHVNVQAPTAELRPSEAKQTDEDDLMPYDVLELVEQSAIRDKRPPVDVLRVLREAKPGVPEATLRGWVRRFHRLFAQNQWKRERYAPGFHVDDENLDPKTWCRFPILSGNFEAELETMDELP